MNCGTTDCIPIYGTKTKTTVAEFHYGKGTVIYMGFDFYDTGFEVDGFHKDCGTRVINWVNEVFKRSLLRAKSISGCGTPGTAAPTQPNPAPPT